jgi:outer membrane receptor for ferrienterochelin and colicins
MKRATITLLAILLTAFAAFADDPPPQTRSEDKELEDLLSIVKQETEVATKTKMNSDYVPGIVTVLEGDELEALGIITAGEALGLVPGVFSVKDRLSNQSVISRGLDFPFNAGNILILINSIPLTRPDAGITTSALQIPVEQIERIEVIRGPGSVVYGDFAFMGLVNIVTRKSGSRAFARLDSPHRSRSEGVRTAFDAGGATFTGNISRYDTGNLGGPSVIRSANDGRWFGIATYDRGGFSLATETAHRDYDGGSPNSRFAESSWVIDAKYTHALATKLDGTLHATYLRNELAETASSFSGHLLRLGADAVWNGLRRNSFLGGVDYTISTTDDARFAAAPPAGAPPGPLTQVLLAHGKQRRITGVYLQDRIDLRPDLSLTLGGRYDAYSDLDSRFTPRVSLAWRISDRHILKAQYAEGFRPPTFFELYSPPPRGTIPRYYFESNATTELNYVYRGAGHVGRITLFREIISNLIRPGGIITDPNAKAEGVEAEWSQQIGVPLKVDTNVSYTETEDPRAPGPSFPRNANLIAPKWLGNLSLLYRPFSGLIIGSHLSHVGERPRGSGFDLVDFTITKQDVGIRGLDLRVGMKNAFDQSVRYLFIRPNVDQTDTFVFPGRSVWMQLSWKR